MLGRSIVGGTARLGRAASESLHAVSNTNGERLKGLRKRKGWRDDGYVQVQGTEIMHRDDPRPREILDLAQNPVGQVFEAARRERGRRGGKFCDECSMERISVNCGRLSTFRWGMDFFRENWVRFVWLGRVSTETFYNTV
jgi:hypothetical protein